MNTHLLFKSGRLEMKRRTLISFATLLLRCRALPPLALHQLVEVEPGGEVVLKLHGVDFEGDDVS